MEVKKNTAIIFMHLRAAEYLSSRLFIRDKNSNHKRDEGTTQSDENYIEIIIIWSLHATGKLLDSYSSIPNMR